MSQLDGLKFHPGKTVSCNHHRRGVVVLTLPVNTFPELTGYVFYISIVFFFLLVERETLSYGVKIR